MAKTNEIDYVREVAELNEFSLSDFQHYLLHKPFSDARCHEYLSDTAQIMQLLPPAPCRLLDVGVGSGWTSELFAKAGYDVLGIDIAADMIDIANQRNCSAKFMVSDYEVGPIPGTYDAAVIYDALHHADDARLIIKNVFDALSDDGIFITVEPGAGHSQTADSIQAMEKYGTTEKDMPFSLQREMMEEIGFGSIEQYVRLSQLPIENVTSLEGSLAQVRHGFTLAYESATGLTSIVVARKKAAGSRAPRIKPEELFQAVMRYDDIALQATWKTKVIRKLLRLARFR